MANCLEFTSSPKPTSRFPNAWRSIFFIHLPVGLFGICLTWRYAEETTQTRDRKLAIFGQAVAIFALADLAAATIEGGALGWTYFWVLAGFTLFALAAAAFVFIESKNKKSARQTGSLIGVALFGSLISQRSHFLHGLHGFSFAFLIRSKEEPKLTRLRGESVPN